MGSRGIEVYLFFKQYCLKYLPYEGVFFMIFGTLIAMVKYTLLPYIRDFSITKLFNILIKRW